VQHAGSEAAIIPAECFPTVPADDFTVFRAACRRLLTPASLALVDKLYCASMDQTNSWLDEQGVQWAASRSIDELPMRPFLHRLTAACVSPAETLVRLRGAQAALFLRGILLSLRWQPGTSIHLADLRTRLDRTTITRLRGLCTPRLAAALTIALITGLPPSALAALNTADITPDGSAVNRAGEWFTVPAHAQALIRALLIERAGDDVNSQAPLFTGRGDSRISEHAMRGMLRSVARKAAIALPTRSTWLYPDPQHDWLAYFGVTVAQLKLPTRA
jgi:integrase